MAGDEALQVEIQHMKSGITELKDDMKEFRAEMQSRFNTLISKDMIPRRDCEVYRCNMVDDVERLVDSKINAIRVPIDIRVGDVERRVGKLEDNGKWTIRTIGATLIALALDILFRK